MSDLKDFLNLIAEGKNTDPSAKRAQQIKENIRGDLSGLFSEIAENKKVDPVTVRSQQIKEKIKFDLSDVFNELSSLKQQKEEIEAIVESKLEPIVEPIQEEKTEEVLIEVAPISTPIGVVAPENQIPDISKYLKSTPKEPEVTLTQRDLKTVNDKIKFLEGWISKIQNTGPGSGEVNFRYLDDVNRATLTPSNDNWVLEYDATTKKVQFTEDIGPVRTIKLNTAGPNIETVPGMLAWNTVEDCMDIHQNDGTTLQAGLENYIRVHNDTGAPLLNGSVVRFSGVDPGVTGVPTAELMDANPLQDPLFLIGVITSDIPIQGTGRATTLGNVRGINTTGSSSNETWVIGDLLWVHPTLDGKLTKIKPTAPDLAISVAAVMVVHATEGVLLVRPNFAPRLSYGTFLNTGDHVAATANTPTNIPIDTVTKSRGFELTGATDSRITCQISGLYNFAVSYQITSTNSSAKNIYFWVRRNGVDQPYTTRRQTINGNAVFQTFACTWTVSLTAGQYVQLMWAVSDTSVRLRHEDATAFAPSSPAVLLTVSEAAL